MERSLNGFRPIPKRHARRGKSKPGLLSWKNADRTATRKRSSFLPNMSGNSARPARTSKRGLRPSNWTTTLVLGGKCKTHIQKATANKDGEAKKDKAYARNE